MNAVWRGFGRGFAIIAVILAIGFAGLLVWAYRPVPTFEPLAYQPLPPTQWPSNGWPRSSPEAQGMSSEKLLAMIDFCQAEAERRPDFYLDSLTVIRHGYVVAEYYPNPNYPLGEMHVIHSATKSIVSMLIGIAIELGHIDSVDQSVLTFFPDLDVAHLDERKGAMSIRDLLSMESGLHSRDSYLYAHAGLLALQQSEDWLQFALDLPMAATPGERYDYSNISTFLLGAILAKTTNSNVLEYANENLFRPLGIYDVRWEWTDGDIPIAWARLWLKPDDWAKLGLLYLQKGRWRDREIVPATWVEESLSPWAFPRNAVDILDSDKRPNREASTRNWVAQRFIRPFTDGYGYQWWLDRGGHYAAVGTNGQFLIVAPEHDLVVVVTSKSRGIDQFLPARIFKEHLLPAIESDAPLPANKVASEQLLASARRAVPKSNANTVPALPSTALRISGITYEMERNPYKTNSIRLTFDSQKSHAQLSYTARESWAPDFHIGLDGVPRFTQTNDGTFVASGTWLAPDHFAVEVEIVGYTTFDRWDFIFTDDRIMVTEHSITGIYTYAGQGSSN